MAKKAFPQIVIKSEQELYDILVQFNEDGYPTSETDFIEAVQYVQNPTLEQQLDKWLSTYEIDLCEHGRKKILKAAKAGKITSWEDYFRKHWEDDDGIKGWLDGNSDNLAGTWHVETQGEDKYDEDGDWIGQDDPSFDEVLDQNDINFVEWPFVAKATKKKVTKKVTKKSTAKRKKR